MLFFNFWDRVLVAHSGPHVVDTSDTRRHVRSKRTYKMTNVWGADEIGRFFVTGATDAAGKPSHFHCRLCCKDVSVLTHGVHEVLRQFQGVKQFARDQRLRLETPGWRALYFEGNPFSDSELERQRERIRRGLLVFRDREYLFAEDLIVDDSGAPDATLPFLAAKVSSLIEVLRLGGPYQLVYQLWSQFTSTASRMNVDVTWSRDEVLFVNFLVPCVHVSMCIGLMVLYFSRSF